MAFGTLVCCLRDAGLPEINSFLVPPLFISLPMDLLSASGQTWARLGPQSPGALGPCAPGYIFTRQATLPFKPNDNCYTLNAYQHPELYLLSSPL